MITTEDALSQTWEFKGIEIQPLSYRRKSDVLTIVRRGESEVGPSDIAAFIYGCICPISELMKGKRNLQWFDNQVGEWMDRIKFCQDDAADAVRIMTEIMENSAANRAQPISDPSMMPDPDAMGND